MHNKRACSSIGCKFGFGCPALDAHQGSLLIQRLKIWFWTSIRVCMSYFGHTRRELARQKVADLVLDVKKVREAREGGLMVHFKEQKTYETLHEHFY
ncbi:hypothetical protein CR513_07750, partial [Mucuna pruriens]